MGGSPMSFEMKTGASADRRSRPCHTHYFCLPAPKIANMAAVTGKREASAIHASNGELKIVRQILRALRHRNYRLFFAGQLVSLIGTFLTQVATVWLVYRLTRNAWWLGVAGFAG